MTIKEITALRKSGQLDEALRNAEIEFSNNANVYTAGALFWCLNDLYKQRNGETPGETFERMKDLYQGYGQADEYMTRTFEAIEKRRLPHAQELKEALERVKAGADPIQYYNEFTGYLNSQNLDESLLNDYGWLIYYTLKRTPLNDAYNRKTKLAQYLKLNLERPSILHSLILSEAVKVEQNTPLQFRIRDFIHLWDIQNLREEDWGQFRTDDGKTLPSLVEKLIGVYVKELKTDGVAATEDMVRVVDKALSLYPNSQNMPYFKATVLMSLGKNEEALKHYRDLILRFPSKFYLWHQAAELVSDINTKIGLLCKALSTRDDESFLGGVRLYLAKTLIEKGHFDNAKAELEKYHQTYQKNGWNLKQEYWDLHNRISNQVNQEDNIDLYTQYSSFADEFIYSSLPNILAVKVNSQKLEDRNHNGRFFIQWTLKSESQIYRLKKPAKFGLDNQMPDGAMFQIKTLNNKIVWIKKSDDMPSVSWLKVVSGTIRCRTDRNGKTYAIVDGVYVSEKLLRHITDGQTINLLAMQQEDGRWQAITIKNKAN